MKKTIKVALYNPYLDTLGGGEKHILSIINVLAEKKAEITIFWDKNLEKEIINRFNLSFIKNVNWFTSLKNFSTIKKLKILSQFDYFFYVTDGSYFFSTAKKNFIFTMIPDKKLYQLNFLNRLKLLNYSFISNSSYTASWLNRWGVKSIVIPPFIEETFFTKKGFKKEKIILSVGRFFPHLHSKNQEKIIETFRQLKKVNDSFKSYQLILAGGLKKEDENYFLKLKSSIKDDLSIVLKPNLSFSKLLQLYQSSTYFWHFTGFGIDEKKHPEQVEHFGIAPLEAAASLSLVFCHNSGGPKNIFKDGETGFLFNSQEELIKKIIYLEKNPLLKEKIKIQSQKMVKKEYNYENFFKKINQIL